MKELRSITSNTLITVGADSAQGVVEIVLLLGEPKYAIDDSGHIVRSRTLTDFRFATTIKGLRDLSETLLETADEAEGVCSRILAKDPEETTG